MDPAVGGPRVVRVVAPLAAVAVSMAVVAPLAAVSRVGGERATAAGGEPVTDAIGEISAVYKLYHPGKDAVELWVVGEAGAAPLVEGIAPELSPDGRTIAFAGDVEDPGNVDIYTIGVDGAGLQRLTKDPQVDTSPDWSADGREIVFEREDGRGHAELFVIGANGSGERQLTTNQVTNDSGPDWSPDGKTILFTRFLGTNAEIMAVDPAGGEPRRITSSAGYDGGANWSPDGTLVAFARDAEEDGEWEVWVMRPDGSGATFVAKYGPVLGFIEWSADGSALLLGGTAADPGKVQLRSVFGGDPLPFHAPAGLASALASGWRITGVELA